MDRLNRLIEANSDQFEREPTTGHFERFEQRLLSRKKAPTKRHISLFWKIAASLLIVLLAGNLWYVFQGRSDSIQPLATQPVDIKEVSFYYTGKINYGIRELESMARQGVGSQREIKQIKTELAQMDSVFSNLKKEYENNPQDDRIINAMIEYYQTKFEIVNTIKSDLEKAKLQKKKYHENTKI